MGLDEGRWLSGEIASRLLREWVSAVESGDPRRVASLYAEDALLLGTFSAAERVGPGAILAYFEELLEAAVGVEIVSEQPFCGSEFASSCGLYNFILGGKVVEARYSFVFVKEGNDWKIRSHHSSLVPESA
ncbi:MAG: SgcJ/EcaC family oxidoreductase [Candidatus Poseidoniia archaeon]|jgi:uncharacterized protein (TIGR02246 family)|nr:SgcJ/EcaC family oxidoreductase [Candidatus Poseidoniia archaeon]MDP6658523.1 SgcJ/EcaC family oxidoreductase [Candidatus Poseidoniia archaeon]MDP6846183.1 SgcJ/EcaC family oxidoreductase [Candidatus Poseidoniia archaeon]MDP7007456.1 SgcJ/EcaC family oxidoreductase [Candidatus Poseidoniia archaeon]|tara:strand:- start:9764 stop:10156 length:393 start_codon:yes stop_codon:yes gene_type:complete